MAGWHDPFYNQAFEEYVFQAFPSDDVFLLWVNDPAVVVGSHQNICREVHVETLRRLGIPVVRRITGGGTRAITTAATSTIPTSRSPTVWIMTSVSAR